MIKDGTLIINTKKSLFEPIRIKIDGTLYESVKITFDFKEKLKKLDPEVLKGSQVAMRKQLNMIFGIPEDLIKDKMEEIEVIEVYNFVFGELGNRKKRKLLEDAGEDTTALAELATKQTKKKDSQTGEKS